MKTQHFKKALAEERARLEQELASIGRRNPSNPADWEALPQNTGQESDANDAADLITGYEENTAILKELEIRYNHVLAAQRRMEEGAYGVCTVCGAVIDEHRLEADPAAANCTEHARGVQHT